MNSLQSSSALSGTPLLNKDELEQARQTRDPRFDGRFFVGVLTTGIYCRPVCPVRVPKKENVHLYPTAAAAAAAGFRPCLRCRPESSPGTPAWHGAPWKVSRALQLIDQGFLDEGSVDELAAELEVGSRQLGRLFAEHLGASPVEIAQTRRLHFAKKLLDETALPLTEICYAAGFGSLRRFNAVFKSTYDRSPRELRKGAKAAPKSSRENSVLTVTLSYRPPFDWRAMLAFLAYRHIPGVEVVTDNSYGRSIELDGVAGDFAVTFDETRPTLQLTVNFPQTRQLYGIVDRVRSLFDLRADWQQISAALSGDPRLAAMLKSHPGLRVPGAWDGFEVAVRAILGQQVTVKAATTMVGRIAGKFGRAYHGDNPGLTRCFPSASTLAKADLSGLGIVGQRMAAIKELAQMVEQGELAISPLADSAQFIQRFCSIKGIGEWTANYVAMRALNDPNAFPHSDLILRRALTDGVSTLTPKQLLDEAEPWQPWRAYTVILLWQHYVSLKQELQSKA